MMAVIGDVVYGELFPADGITPKDGDKSRFKMIVILGQNDEGDLIGGVVINSKINNRNIASQYPVSEKKYSFLKHASFVNCDNLITLTSTRVASFSLLGQMGNDDLKYIRQTVIDSKVVKGKLKKKFNLFD